MIFLQLIVIYSHIHQLIISGIHKEFMYYSRLALQPVGHPMELPIVSSMTLNGMFSENMLQARSHIAEVATYLNGQI